MKPTNQELKIIRKMLQRAKKNIRPKMDEAGRPDLLDLMAAQNTLCVCMEVVFNECLPYDEQFCTEMATRLACYGLSALPMDSQDEACAIVSNALLPALRRRVQAGIVIGDAADMPKKGDVQ